MEDELEVLNDNRIGPLPFYPALAKVLSGVTMALLVTYLEIHYPAPERDSQATTGHSSAPFSVDCDHLCRALGVNRRTLHIAFYCLASWWKGEEARSAAARSGREFLNPLHTRYGKVKPYSLIGKRDQRINQTFVIHRNYGRINQILTSAHIDSWQEPKRHLSITYREFSQPSPSTSSEHNLAEILEKAVHLGVRNGQTEERRKAVSVKMKAYWEMRKKSG